ncbi:MAG: hypothetical protein EOO10_05795 [Chitinophagaceae bacterium]|nr:MAG: hypothetical protein EOO10_05795 [Chitinophagaceae bacterium]
MRLSLTALFIIFCSLAFGQDTFKPSQVRRSILALIKLLPTYSDSAQTEYIQNTYDTIFNKATDNELYELTNHPNPLVRRSSFYTLLERYSPKVLKLLQKNAGDTTQYFQVQYGCLVERQTFLDELLFYLSPQSGWDRNFKISAEQKQKIRAAIARREKERKDYLMNR